MTVLPGSPRLIKGAIVAFDPFNPLASIIIFQYNPSELSRTLEPQTDKTSKTPVGAQRLTGPPAESFTLSVEINAIDQLEGGSGAAGLMGIYPQLSALEMLMFPKTAQVLAGLAKQALGVMELMPPEAPLTLFVWGAKRVVPVQLKSYKATETYHDPNLNPLSAKVDLTLKILTYQDFTRSQKGFSLFLVNQALREAMATVGSVSNLAAVAGGALK